MSGEEIVETPKAPKREKRGSTQPLDGEFAQWLERQFRGGEAPHSVDAYPLFRGRDKEERLFHYDIKADETISTERAVDLSNDIWSDCQIHCDRLPRVALNKEGTKTYQIVVIDDRRGGIAKPVGTWLLNLEPRIHQPAPINGEDNEFDAEDGDALTSRKMMLEVFKETVGRNERGQAAMGNIMGDVMMLQKEHVKDSFIMIRELLGENRAMMREIREMFKDEGQRRVEEKAVNIDAENAAVEREARRAVLQKEHMWTNVMQAGMLEGVKVLGHLFPGFGQLFSALLQGKPPPPPPQLPANGTTPSNGANGTNGSNGTHQLPAVSEKTLLDRFVETAEKTRFDDNLTIGEKLFGKDENGKVVEPGIFTREQVSILTGIHVGTVPLEALDGLLPNSGKSEAIQGLQMAKAMAVLTPEMVADISKILEMRQAAKQ